MGASAEQGAGVEERFRKNKRKKHQPSSSKGATCACRAEASEADLGRASVADDVPKDVEAGKINAHVRAPSPVMDFDGHDLAPHPAPCVSRTQE